MKRTFHPVVIALLAGTAVVQLFRAMCYPFLAIFLTNRTSMSIEEIGLTISLGALAGTVGGLFGGTLSDRYGRKNVMLVALAVSALFYAGYAWVHQAWLLVALLMVYGLFGSFFEPASRALMGDLTEQNLRVRVFSIRYMLVNFGYFFGPLLGLWLGLTGQALPFLIMAVIYLFYLVVLWGLLRSYERRGFGVIADVQQSAPQRPELRNSLRLLGQDRALQLLLLGGLLSTVVHGLWSVPVSQYVSSEAFSLLLVVNSGVVILLQPFFGRLMEKKISALHAVTLGSVLFAVGEIGFATAGSTVWFVVAMVVFTIGEILVLPAEFMLIDNITPDGMRGTYYGAQSLTSLGNFVSPWLSAILLSHFGGPVLFVVMAGVALVSLVFFQLGNLRSLTVTKTQGQVVSK